VLSDVTKNAIALYMVELLQKCLKQPENNTELFEFVEDALMLLDRSDDAVAANFPVYFGLQLAQFFGFTIRNTYTDVKNILDLQEGIFTEIPPHHSHYLKGEHSLQISELMKALHPEELSQIRMNKFLRRDLLIALQTFYSFQMPDFGVMKTLPILQEILS
jgi:DNA repair protein RecO (recombination protein O)